MAATSPKPNRSVRSALILVFASRYTSLAIGLISTMLLARLVTPAQTGLFSVAASAVLLAQAIHDFGIDEFLVQERDLTPSKIRTAFGFTLILSWSLGLGIFLARHRIAGLYGTPDLARLIGIACGCLFVAPFGSTVMGLLNREMAFGRLFRISFARMIANQTVSVLLALLGFGAAALTWGMLAASITTALAALLLAPSLDHVLPSLRAWRSLAAFSAYISIANIVDQIGTRAPDLIIGRLLGYGPLGFYNRAGGVVRLFSDLVVAGVQAVAFPAFAGVHRAGEDLRAPYLRAVALLTGVMLPVLAMLAMLARPLVQLLLGHQWLPIAPLIPFFCAGMALETLAPLVTPFLNATGRVSIVLRIALTIRGLQLLLIGGVAHLGLPWLAMAQVLLGLTGLLVNVHFLREAIAVNWRDLLKAARLSLAVTGLTLTLPAIALAERGGTQNPAWSALALGLALGGTSWIGAVFGLRHPLGREMAALLRELRGMLGPMAT